MEVLDGKHIAGDAHTTSCERKKQTRHFWS